MNFDIIYFLKIIYYKINELKVLDRDKKQKI